MGAGASTARNSTKHQTTRSKPTAQTPSTEHPDYPEQLRRALDQNNSDLNLFKQIIDITLERKDLETIKKLGTHWLAGGQILCSTLTKMHENRIFTEDKIQEFFQFVCQEDQRPKLGKKRKYPLQACILEAQRSGNEKLLRYLIHVFEPNTAEDAPLSPNAFLARHYMKIQRLYYTVKSRAIAALSR